MDDEPVLCRGRRLQSLRVNVMPTGFFRLDPGDEAVFRDGDTIGLRLEEVLVEDHEDTQHVVLNFSRRTIASGSDGIELWATPVEQAHADGSGAVIPMDGQVLLQVSVPGAQPRPDMTAPDVTVSPGGLVDDLVMTGAFTGFEGGGALYIGLSSTDAEYRLSSSDDRSEEHTSELQSRGQLVCRLLLEKKKTTMKCE